MSECIIGSENLHRAEVPSEVVNGLPPGQTATNAEAINLQALRLDVCQAIATAKIAEFENQTYRLGEIVKLRLISRTVAGDVLYRAALSNGLVREHGEDFIQLLMSEGLNGGGVQ